MKSKKVIIIGANEFQYKIIDKVNKLGYETHVFAWEEGAIAKDIATVFYPISITDKEKILEEAKEIKPDAVISIASDLAMPTVNYIAEKLGLVGNSLLSTELMTNKFKMRKRLSENNLPCPWYQLISGCNDLKIDKLDFPLIVKPIDRSGSRGVTKVSSPNELKSAIDLAKDVSFLDVVLIEKYIGGSEYSIETISQAGKHQILQITEKFTTGEPNYIELGHLQPARISKKIQQNIEKVIIDSLTALEFENGASHAEIKVDNDQIFIIEIGGRMGGDFIGSDMVEISTGIDFLKLVLDVSLGKDIGVINCNNVNNNFAVVKFLFSQRDIERYNKIKAKFPNIVIEENINKNFNNDITDSSNRNGYYILNIPKESVLTQILKIGFFDD